VRLTRDCDGAEHFPAAFDPAQWVPILKSLPHGKAGVRLFGVAGVSARLGPGSPAHDVASQLIGSTATPVRAILFDKGKGNNWPLDWHQDRTIAVRERHECEGFGPWTVKHGVAHVEPPFAFLSRMVTLRLHLDVVDADNAPLRIARGSHRQGLIPEADYDAVVTASDIFECLAEAGDIWAYATPILHASRPATHPRRRRVIQIDYSADSLPEPLEWAGV
jgi:hypothetical protein